MPMTTLVAAAESRGCSGWMMAMYLRGGKRRSQGWKAPMLQLLGAVLGHPCVGVVL